jgi:hypothetical protein
MRKQSVSSAVIEITLNMVICQHGCLHKFQLGYRKQHIDECKFAALVSSRNAARPVGTMGGDDIIRMEVKREISGASYQTRIAERMTFT